MQLNNRLNIGSVPDAHYQAIERERPDKFRKLQEATRSAQALMDQHDGGKIAMVKFFTCSQPVHLG